MNNRNNWFRNDGEKDRQPRYEGYAPSNNARQSLFDNKRADYRNSYYDERMQPDYSQIMQPPGAPQQQQAAPQGRSYSGIVVYQPRSSEDVQMLIDYLKRNEPAIVNLDAADEDLSQRILDFISGAVYALSGSVHRISGNIFLLAPDGVDISIPY